MENDQDVDDDAGMVDVNEVPRFGVARLTTTLGETARAFSDLYDQHELIYQAASVRLFKCTRRGEPSADGAPRAYVVKKFVQPWRPAGDNGPFMNEVARKRVAREVEIMNELTLRPDLFAEVQEVFVTRYMISIVLTKYEQDLHALAVQKQAAGGSFDDSEVRTVAQRMLAALAYLHDSLGVAHRDLKHQNVFLKRAGDVGTAVLGDLGHARSLNTQEQASTHGANLGTRDFNPPEMRLGAPGPHTRRVDIYQLGALLYLLVFGIGTYALNDLVDVLRHRAFFTHPPAIAAWNAAAAAGGAAGAARAACLRRMLANQPLDRGSARDNLADPWVAGAV